RTAAKSGGNGTRATRSTGARAGTGTRPATVAPWVRWRRRAAVAPVAPLVEPRKRLWRGTVIIMALFVVVALRLVYFQFGEASQLAVRGLHPRLEKIDLPAQRGDILDRNGNVLAGSAEARYVFADPTRVEDPQGVADALSPVLGVPASQLLPKLLPHLNE